MRLSCAAACAVVLLVTGCKGFEDALTVHARPAAETVGYRLDAEELGRMMAASSMPDTSLTEHWAKEIARLWIDYVSLAALYRNPDTTMALDYSRLLEDERFVAAAAVARYRDSVVLAGLEPAEEEQREYFERRQPFTRLDLRRIVFALPKDADDRVRDSVSEMATEIRDRVVGGGDFLSVAREYSTEPVEARGQVLAYQGHSDVPAVADSVLFHLGPGEVSPVFEAGDTMYVFRVEGRHSPRFEDARKILMDLMVRERTREREQHALDSLLDRAQRNVPEEAVEIARRVAADPALETARIPRGMRLVTWKGGELTVDDLRRLFLVRSDIRTMFSEDSDEEVHGYLLDLAKDEILIAAAREEGAEPSEDERAEMAGLLAYQLAKIAQTMGLSHPLVTAPEYELKGESLAFVERVLRGAKPMPWLGMYRVELDPTSDSRVDVGGAEAAARLAREFRMEGLRGEAEDRDEAGDDDSAPAGPPAEPEAPKEDTTWTGVV